MGKNQNNKNQKNAIQNNAIQNNKNQNDTIQWEKIVGVVVAIWLMCFVTASAVTAGASQGFKDLPVSHWAYSSIKKMCEVGIVKGYPDQSFKPEKPVSYGEYMKMATVILDGKDAGTETGENRMGENWAGNYYRKGLANGFYTEYDIPEVKLNWQMTRGDMALVISGLLGNEKVENYDWVAGSIIDVHSKTKHEYEIVKAYATGILEGYPDGTFRPEGTLSRAEAATSLYKIVQKKAELNVANVSNDANNANYTYISNIAGNKEAFWKEDWVETEKYEIVSPEAAGLKIRVSWNGRLASFDHNLVGFIYLIKDGKIIQYCRSIPAETYITSGSHTQLEEIDFIMCIPSKHGVQKTILLVENPFGRQV